MSGFGDNFEYRGKLKKTFKNNLVSIVIYFLLNFPLHIEIYKAKNVSIF